MSKSAARFSAAVAVRVAVAAAVLLSLAGCGSLVLATADTPACVTPGPVSRADSFKTSVALTTAKDVSLRLVDLGVLVKDTHDQTLRFAPPLVTTAAEIDWLLIKVAAALREAHT